MKKMFFALFALLLSAYSFAQIEGRWKTIDDETKQPKSIVEIYKTAQGTYNGKIVQLLIKPAKATCADCKDDRKNKPLLGMDVIRGLKKDGNEFSGGTITDPKTGKTYKCTVTRQGNNLDVRGYIGFSFVGRSQTWVPAK